MTRLLLVRHGETDWNRQHRHQGQKDIPLNALGRRQVDAISQRLARTSIDAVYSSDLSREWETATAILSRHDGLVLVKEPRLREMNFGDWEGLTWSEIQEQDPSILNNWSELLLEPGPPGGENLIRFKARILEISEEIIKKHPNDTVLVVAHGGPLMVLVCLLIKHPIDKYWQFRIEKVSLSEIDIYPEGAIINLLNDISHLSELV